MPDLSEWNTAITEVADSTINYRGTPISGLIDDGDLASTLWLVLFGTTPGPGQADAFRRALIAALDHSVMAPSTLAARAAASTRGPIPLAIAAGLVAFSGPAHGGAAEEAAKIFARVAAQPTPEEALRAEVEALVAAGRRVPGYGHPYHTTDPRVAPLMRGIVANTVHRDLARACEEIVRDLTGRSLRMNADSAVGALLLDADLRPEDVTLVTALGRAYGLSAHAREEQLTEKPFRAPAVGSVHMRPISNAGSAQ